jgi:hypothetical protein
MAAAIILVAIGIVLLLSNLGVLDWSLWDALWRLWPLILIGIGLDLMLKRKRLGGLIAGLVVAGVFILVVLVMHTHKAPLVTEVISQPLEGAKQARVILDAGVARLNLTAGQNPDKLIEGTLRVSKRAKLKVTYELKGDLGKFKLKQRSRGLGLLSFGKRNPQWDLKLTKEIPVILEVDTGVGQSDLDLRGMQITSLDVDSGVGQTTVTLPARGNLKVDMDGGVGEVIIRIPETLAARIHAKSGIGSVDVSGPFKKEDSDWISDNYATATDKVDLDISGGIGTIDIEVIKAPQPPAPEPAEEEKKPVEDEQPGGGSGHAGE